MTRVFGEDHEPRSFVVQNVINIISHLGTKKVAVTASTGVASQQLGFDATTLHHWAGIQDGRFSKEKYRELFLHDDAYSDSRRRIEKTSVLVIDEISMVSARTFDLVEHVCRLVKGNNHVFGGMQIIACGDFKQLSPVPNPRYGDGGLYAFESPCFHLALPHHIQLKMVRRQHEKELVDAIHQLCDGSPTPETLAFCSSLDRPLFPPNAQPTLLYGTNFDVSYVNHVMLEDMEGEEIKFEAVDEGNIQLLRKSPVQKHLLLKKDAPVILLKNLASGLYNGMRGTIHSLEKDKPPVVNFSGKLVTMKQANFDIFDPDRNVTLACRKQYPLSLAFALTVHRAQGQTLEFVEVDCYSFFCAGQLGVALGRATTIDGLRIRNFNQDAAFLKHPQKVFDFYNETFLVPEDDLECCNSSSSALCEIPSETAQQTEEQKLYKEDFHQEEENSQEFQHIPDDFKYNINDFLDENKSAQFLKSFSLEFLCSQTIRKHACFLQHKVENYMSSRLRNPPEFTAFYHSINSFLLSDEHINYAKLTFNVQQVTKEQNKFSSKLTLWIIDQILASKASAILEEQEDSLNLQHVQGEQTQGDISCAAKNKVRYLAGRCVYKIRRRLQDSVLHRLGSTSRKMKALCNLDYKKQAILQKLRIKEEDVNTNDQTVLEIKAKQGESRGLTIVSEPVFKFFISLHRAIQSSLTIEHINFHTENIHQFLRNKIDENYSLIQEWISICKIPTDSDIEDEIVLQLIIELFQDISEHFIKLSLVDSLKEFKRQVPRKKKMALRSKVTALSERKSGQITKKRKRVEAEPGPN
ncbi:uncharacterized protein LOC133181165 [Saccostrea echinata]|uniref:uncharacterized protein LOC133181165 n=1 Tax=Saccostrea echinata TaxID=191078 RepID=UPI002A82074E|nr:uncharacterized protein LOC133181165 [Saccostrea echinata]